MRVYDLLCDQGHKFEGWFPNAEVFEQQLASQLVNCPLCGEPKIARLPCAPHLNLARRSASPTEQPPPQGLGSSSSELESGVQRAKHWSAEVSSSIESAAYLAMVRKLLASTRDVGAQFAEEARKMHYGEVEPSGIRGQASADEAAELREEGIEFFVLHVPSGAKEPLQ